MLFSAICTRAPGPGPLRRPGAIAATRVRKSARGLEKRPRAGRPQRTIGVSCDLEGNTTQKIPSCRCRSDGIPLSCPVSIGTTHCPTATLSILSSYCCRSSGFACPAVFLQGYRARQAPTTNKEQGGRRAIQRGHRPPCDRAAARMLLLRPIKVTVALAKGRGRISVFETAILVCRPIRLSVSGVSGRRSPDGQQTRRRGRRTGSDATAGRIYSVLLGCRPAEITLIARYGPLQNAVAV